MSEIIEEMEPLTYEKFSERFLSIFGYDDIVKLGNYHCRFKKLWFEDTSYIVEFELAPVGNKDMTISCSINIFPPLRYKELGSLSILLREVTGNPKFKTNNFYLEYENHEISKIECGEPVVGKVELSYEYFAPHAGWVTLEEV